MLTMEDKGLALALKARRPNAKNSMAVGIDLIKNGEADAFVTMGNTGACLATAYFRLGTIAGVDLPTLAVSFPSAKGSFLLVDLGANPDCKAENLLQFALMGSVYADKMKKVKNPRVALISNGEEEGKGNELVKAAIPLLKDSGLNYIGCVEGKEVYSGEVDVVVMDGFTGNVFLKASEAVAKLLIDTIRETIKNGNLLTRIGGLLVRPALGSIRKLMDPSEYGAASLLGVNGLVFIGHGRSDARAVQVAIRVAKEAVEAKVLNAMKSAIEESLKK
jgi:glycerol-3-phosphate acyltransferase PlsX